jgi:Lrp/AsnC family leucine-responsive transcriptional regulator
VVKRPEVVTLDRIDKLIVLTLNSDARTSLKKLSAKVGLSSPSVSERLRSLSERGVITAFTLSLDPRTIGYALQAIVRVKSLPGMLHKVERLIRQTPEFIECDKVTGDDAFVCRICVRSMEQLDEILDRFQDVAQTSTSMIKTSPVKRRLPPLD